MCCSVRPPRALEECNSQILRRSRTMWHESRFCLRTDRTRGQTWARGVAAAPGLCHRRLGRRTCLPQSSCQTSKASPGRTAAPALWSHRRCPTTSRSTGPALTQQQVPSTPKAPVMPARALEECNSLIVWRSLTMWHESRFFFRTDRTIRWAELGRERDTIHTSLRSKCKRNF